MKINEYNPERGELLYRLKLPEMNYPMNIKPLWVDHVTADIAAERVSNEVHYHSIFEVHMVHEGEVLYRVAGKVLKLTAGRALFLPPNTIHQHMRCSSDSLKTVIVFNCSVLQFDTPRVFCFSPALSDGLNYMLKMCMNRDILAPYLICGKAFEMLCSIFEILNIKIPEDNRDCSDARLLVAMQFINSSQNRAVTSDEVAKECGLSSRQLNRLFKIQTGESLYQYIVRSKMERAKLLLSQKEPSIKEVGFMLGFNTETGFISFFKRHCSTSPATFRKEILEGLETFPHELAEIEYDERIVRQEDDL